jgi:glycosyltransferase involved in cell wall biosynthesis
MALGAPLMASNVAAIPEVVGEAGRLVDPYDVDAMTRALKELDGDTALRSRLAAAGRQRAALFSLNAYQDRLAALHARLLDGGRPSPLPDQIAGDAS